MSVMDEATYRHCFVEGWYNNDSDGQKRAINHFQRLPECSTLAERRANLASIRHAKRAALCKGGCGKAMPKGSTCYWCRARSATERDGSLSITAGSDASLGEQQLRIVVTATEPARLTLDEMKELVRQRKAAKRRVRRGSLGR